jgi:3-dehydroquinate synthase
LTEAGATRGTVVVALGGGTVTDLVGFVASIHLRGVKLVLCPTTTLSQCDAAIGGKNGVNHGGLKNVLGTTRQPDLVLADTCWLDTLPDDLHREGLVEAVKAACVLDAAAFEEAERLAPALARRDAGAVEAVVARAIAVKMEVVARDENEADRRRWLNFGHTIGHAVESVSKNAVHHGRAVAMGMVAECRAAGEAVPREALSRLTALLTTLALPTAIPADHADPRRLFEIAVKDKKATRSDVPMIVPSAVGKGVVVPLTLARLEAALR